MTPRGQLHLGDGDSVVVGRHLRHDVGHHHHIESKQHQEGDQKPPWKESKGPHPVLSVALSKHSNRRRHSASGTWRSQLKRTLDHLLGPVQRCNEDWYRKKRYSVQRLHNPFWGLCPFSFTGEVKKKNGCPSTGPTSFVWQCQRREGKAKGAKENSLSIRSSFGIDSTAEEPRVWR